MGSGISHLRRRGRSEAGHSAQVHYSGAPQSAPLSGSLTLDSPLTRTQPSWAPRPNWRLRAAVYPGNGGVAREAPPLHWPILGFNSQPPPAKRQLNALARLEGVFSQYLGAFLEGVGKRRVRSKRTFYLKTLVFSIIRANSDCVPDLNVLPPCFITSLCNLTSATV